MEESKVEYRGAEVIDRPPGHPPAYSSGPPPGPYPREPPGLYGPLNVPAAPAVVGVGMVGTNVGMVGTNVGMVGTSVGMVGTNVGMVGTTAVPVMLAQQISPKPASMVCKSCHAEIVTRVEQKATIKTHFFAALLCLMGCWCCCCIPYCTDSCMNSDHYCPNCNAYIGSYVT